ncbi:MAG: phosphoadenylyl-sulfate reductase [Betaproteobacteria bacterium]|nr:phosphoadenylyl-sulfate reductase [Betaproteobacteria bacterium]
MEEENKMSLEQKIEEVVALLQGIERDHAPAAFANSLGAEDMILTDLIIKHAPGIEIFSLDTGRLPEETHQLMHELVGRYKVPLRIYFPEDLAVEHYTQRHGSNGFFESVELRKSCCHIRKVEPLQRALQGKKAWLTGLRRQQATTRAELLLSEWDADHQLHKFNPLAEWKHADVWTYLYQFDVPYNALHDQGFPSIGCAPCTRAVAIGEDVRAGRWWWENPLTKECGLHCKKIAT